MALKLRPIMFLVDGPGRELSGSIPDPYVIQYEVVGLPPKKSALIGKKDGHWRILRVEDNLPDAWRGSYESAEAALAALDSDPLLSSDDLAEVRGNRTHRRGD